MALGHSYCFWKFMLMVTHDCNCQRNVLCFSKLAALDDVKPNDDSLAILLGSVEPSILRFPFRKCNNNLCKSYWWLCVDHIPFAFSTILPTKLKHNLENVDLRAFRRFNNAKYFNPSWNPLSRYISDKLIVKCFFTKQHLNGRLRYTRCG